MIYSFHPEAEAEFRHAFDYYEKCEKGLGYDFAVEVYSAIERAVSYPKTWPIIEDEIRRTLVRRFPYGILYTVEPDEILIIAVMHLHRDPEYWKKRASE
jgi:plasmid stabilization system protein ParE